MQRKRLYRLTSRTERSELIFTHFRGFALIKEEKTEKRHESEEEEGKEERRRIRKKLKESKAEGGVVRTRFFDFDDLRTYLRTDGKNFCQVHN